MTSEVIRRPTMTDVAKLAGVSLKTVSRVINNVSTVDRELAERVLTAVTELGFRRNDIARSLRAQQRSATVGLLIEDLANPFYSSIAGAAAQTAFGHDTMLITASSEEDADRERRLLLDMCERRVDGLLIVPAGADHSYLRAEIEMGLPLVFLDRPPTNLRADAVLIDNTQGVIDGIDHLIRQGHRDIAVIGDHLNIFTMRTRLAAAEKALDDAAAPYRPELIRDGLHTSDDIESAVREMLAAPAPPTAIFALNNRLTLGALKAIRSASVPVEVVGFDDLEAAHLLAQPPTLITYDAAELGRVGAELLFGRIDGNRSRPQTVLLPTRLVEYAN